MDTINVWPKENFAKFQRLVFEIRELIHRQTDRQTDTLIAILRTL